MMALLTEEEKREAEGFHFSVKQALRWFSYGHLQEPLKAVVKPYKDLAWSLARSLPADPETTTALRKLCESKDAAVRAFLAGQEA